MSLIHGRLERTRGAGDMVQGSTGAGLAQPLVIPVPAASLNCSQADREGLCLGTPMADSYPDVGSQCQLSKAYCLRTLSAPSQARVHMSRQKAGGIPML